MRVHGWCQVCKKVSRVDVTGQQVAAALACGGPVIGTCDECEAEARARAAHPSAGRPERDSRCSAARTKDGYWTCDVPGGCRDCRRLARDIEDWSCLDDWRAEVAEAKAAEAPVLIRQDDSLTGPPPCRSCRRGDHDRCTEPCGCLAPVMAHAD